MPTVDLAFALRGTHIPLDYGYALFGAISRLVPSIHGDRRVGVHPIRGIKSGRGRLSLFPESKLRLRLPSEEIGAYLPLAEASLELDGARLQVGVPRKEDLIPAPSLGSRLVTIGHRIEPAEFLDSVNRQLTSLGLSALATFPPSTDPTRPDEPPRRILRVKERSIVGYAVRVEGLTAEESLLLQERGLGSRRRMGCGVFVRQGERRAHE